MKTYKEIISKMTETIIESFEDHIEQNDHDQVEEFLTQFKNLDLANYNKGYFFRLSVQQNDLELFKLFIQHGADITYDEYTILHSCVYNRCDKNVEYLLKECNVDIKTFPNQQDWVIKTVEEFIDNNYRFKHIRKSRITGLYELLFDDEE